MLEVVGAVVVLGKAVRAAESQVAAARRVSQLELLLAACKAAARLRHGGGHVRLDLGFGLSLRVLRRLSLVFGLLLLLPLLLLILLMTWSLPNQRGLTSTNKINQ